MAGQLQANFSGFREIEAALLRLPKELAETVEKDVLRQGMVPVRKAAKKHLMKSKKTGLLTKSLGLNVRRVRKKGQTTNRYTARVGPRGGFRKQVGVHLSGKKAGKPKFQDPTKYAHLVEYGTSHSAAKPFIRPAVDECQGQIAEAMAKGYEKGLDKVVRKIRSRK